MGELPATQWGGRGDRVPRATGAGPQCPFSWATWLQDELLFSHFSSAKSLGTQRSSPARTLPSVASPQGGAVPDNVACSWGPGSLLMLLSWEEAVEEEREA